MTNILITGGNGFVGSNLTNYLINNCYKVDILDISEPKNPRVGNWIIWEKLTIDLLNNYDVVIHLAGKAHDTKNKSLVEEYFKINTQLTQRIFDKFINSKAKKFIFFSSVKAVADSVNEEVLVEEVVPSPIGPYGESKLLAEKYINEVIVKSRSLIEDKSIYILRPCMIHGPGNKGNLNLLYSIVKKGIPWPLGSYENLRSFTSIDNLNFIIDKFIENEVPSGVYNISDDHPLSTNQLIELICKSTNKKPRIIKINKRIIALVAKISDTLRLPLNSQRLKKLTENYIVSNTKLKNSIGVDELPTTPEEGLTKTIESFNK